MKWTECVTNADKWAWHAEVYAHRRVILNVPDTEHTSPADPTGEWFNEFLVNAATERLQNKLRIPRHD